MELMDEGMPDDRCAKAILTLAGVGSLALGAIELRTGLPTDTLGLVADAWHNFGDGPVYLLRGLAIGCEPHRSNRMRKVAAGIMMAGAAITGYETVDVAVSTPVDEYMNSKENKPLAPLALAMVGNLAITGLVLAERKSQHAVTGEAKQHALLDAKHSFFRLGAAATRLPMLDMAAAVYYGVSESVRLSWRMFQSSHEGHNH